MLKICFQCLNLFTFQALSNRAPKGYIQIKSLKTVTYIKFGESIPCKNIVKYANRPEEFSQKTNNYNRVVFYRVSGGQPIPNSVNAHNHPHRLPDHGIKRHR